MGVGMGLVLLLASAGLIAYLGDLIGRRIGRKRLTLFGLRPKNTAIVITVATGIGIAAVTMAVILLVSRDLRERIFGYEKTVGALRSEAARQTTAAARSKAELAAAEADLGVQKKRVATEQRAAEQAESARRAAEGRLATAQARYQQAAAMAARKAREAQAAQRRLQAAQARVHTAERNVASLAAQLSALRAQADAEKARLASLEKRIADANRELVTAEQELAQAAKELENAVGVVNRARQEVQALQEEEARIREAARQDMERVLEATAGTILYHSGEELDRALVAEPTAEATAATLQRLVSRINDKARARGAGEYDKERLPGIVAVAIGRGGDDRTLRPEDYLPAVMRFLVAEGRPAWLRAQVVANCFPGRPLYYTFRLYPDRVAFRAGEEVSRVELDGSRTEIDIVNDLRDFVATRVRPATEAAGMLPPLSGVNEVGPAVWLPALRQIQVIDGPVTVSAVATKETGVGDPLAIEFRVTARP